MTVEDVELAPGGSVPDLDRPVGTAGRQQRTVVAPRRLAQGRGAVLERLEERSRAYVPDLRALVARRGDDAPPVRREDGAATLLRVALEPSQQPSAARLPHVDDLLAAA